MDEKLQEISRLAQTCDCGNEHFAITIETIRIGRHMLREAADYIAEKSFLNTVMVTDANTYRAAGAELERELAERGADCRVIRLIPNANGDVLADELSIVQTLLETPSGTQALLAVGSGTIHDIARAASYKMNMPFISIPTAPSVDGYSSMGAPLVVRGFKKTYQLHCPIAVFADLDVLIQAPPIMRAAGFGDMIAKFTSLVDWQFSHLAAREPYCPFSARLTREALTACVERLDAIAQGTEEGIRSLTEGLMVSGLAMLLFGQSHPASGGEHHVSHMWEMEALKNGKKQMLHGAKVGVSSRMIAARYKNEFLPLLEPVSDPAQQLPADLPEPIRSQREPLAAAVKALPEEGEYRRMLALLGGPTEPEELGLDEAAVEQSLQTAHTIRDRFTILRFLNERAAR